MKDMCNIYNSVVIKIGIILKVILTLQSGLFIIVYCYFFDSFVAESTFLFVISPQMCAYYYQSSNQMFANELLRRARRGPLQYDVFL